jgi:hypothetical protein
MLKHRLQRHPFVFLPFDDSINEVLGKRWKVPLEAEFTLQDVLLYHLVLLHVAHVIIDVQHERVLPG